MYKINKCIKYTKHMMNKMNVVNAFSNNVILSVSIWILAPYPSVPIWILAPYPSVSTWILAPYPSVSIWILAPYPSVPINPDTTSVELLLEQHSLYCQGTDCSRNIRCLNILGWYQSSYNLCRICGLQQYHLGTE